MDAVGEVESTWTSIIAVLTGFVTLGIVAFVLQRIKSKRKLQQAEEQLQVASSERLAHEAEMEEAFSTRIDFLEQQKAQLQQQLIELDEEKEANRAEQRVLVEELRAKSEFNLKPYEIRFAEIELKKRIGAGTFGEV